MNITRNHPHNRGMVVESGTAIVCEVFMESKEKRGLEGGGKGL